LKFSEVLTRFKSYLRIPFVGLFMALVSGPSIGYEGWIGTITYRDEFSMGMSIKDDAPNIDAKCSETREVEVRVQACFKGDGSDAIYAAGEPIIFKHDHKESYQGKASYALCCGKDRSVPMLGANTAERSEGCGRGPGGSVDKSSTFETLRTGDVEIQESSMLVRWRVT
jgi:hypothetical protein